MSKVSDISSLQFEIHLVAARIFRGDTYVAERLYISEVYDTM